MEEVGVDQRVCESVIGRRKSANSDWLDAESSMPVVYQPGDGWQRLPATVRAGFLPPQQSGLSAAFCRSRPRSGIHQRHLASAANITDARRNRARCNRLYHGRRQRLPPPAETNTPRRHVTAKRHPEAFLKSHRLCPPTSPESFAKSIHRLFHRIRRGRYAGCPEPGDEG